MQGLFCAADLLWQKNSGDIATQEEDRREGVRRKRIYKRRGLGIKACGKYLWRTQHLFMGMPREFLAMRAATLQDFGAMKTGETE